MLDTSIDNILDWRKNKLFVRIYTLTLMGRSLGLVVLRNKNKRSKYRSPKFEMQKNKSSKKQDLTNHTIQQYDPKFEIHNSRSQKIYPPKTSSQKYPKIKSNARDPKLKIQKQIHQNKKKQSKTTRSKNKIQRSRSKAQYTKERYSKQTRYNNKIQRSKSKTKDLKKKRPQNTSSKQNNIQK